MKVYVVYEMVCGKSEDPEIVLHVYKSYSEAIGACEFPWDIVPYELPITWDVFDASSLVYDGKVLEFEEDFEPMPFIGVTLRQAQTVRSEFAWLC